MSNKTKHIAVHVTPSEYAAIQKMASSDGRSVSEWSRLRLIRAEPPFDPDEELARQERRPLPEPGAWTSSTTDREIPPEHRKIIQRHQQQAIREFKPYTKADQAGRKKK